MTCFIYISFMNVFSYRRKAPGLRRRFCDKLYLVEHPFDIRMDVIFDFISLIFLGVIKNDLKIAN